MEVIHWLTVVGEISIDTDKLKINIKLDKAVNQRLKYQDMPISISILR